MSWDETPTLEAVPTPEEISVYDAVARLCRNIHPITEKCRVMFEFLKDIPMELMGERMDEAARMVQEARQLIDRAFEVYAESIIARYPPLPPLPKDERSYLQLVVVSDPQQRN